MPCEIIAFYGFKGGAGRSFLLANIAALLVAEGKRVLVMDVDLEAPGLGDFFDDRADTTRGAQGVLGDAWRKKKGYIDLLQEEADPDVPIGEDQKAFDQRVDVVAESVARKLGLDETGNLTEDSEAYLTLIDGQALAKKEAGDVEQHNGRLAVLGPGSLKRNASLGSLNYVP